MIKNSTTKKYYISFCISSVIFLHFIRSKCVQIICFIKTCIFLQRILDLLSNIREEIFHNFYLIMWDNEIDGRAELFLLSNDYISKR